MPARPALRRFSHIERFICPFLAPRVFAPWPKYRQLSTASPKEPCSPERATCKLMAGHPAITATSTLVTEGYGMKINEAYLGQLTSHRNRTKSIGSEKNPETGKPDEFSSFWTLRFASLEAEFHKQKVLPSEVEFELDPEVETWIEELHMSPSLTNVHSTRISEAWARYPANLRHYRWLQIMLWTLRYAPRHALRFLKGTHIDTHPPSYAVADSLNYIACYYLQDAEYPQQRFLREIHDTTLLLLKKRSQILPIRDHTIYLLLKRIDIEDAVRLQDALLDHSVPMRHDTFFHFIQIFATNRQLGRVWTLLDFLRESHADVSSKQGMSMWSTLFTWSKSERGSSRIHSALLQRMIDLGVRPNVINYSIIIENAIETDGWEAGWRTFELMKKDGVVPNEYTYAILFHGAKTHGNKEAMGHILDLARAEGHLLENAHLTTDLIHAVYKSTRDSRRYRQILDVYKQYFDVRPLKDLWLANHLFKQDDPDTLMQPTRVTLGVMLMAYLDIRNNQDLTPKLYTHYRKLIREGNHQLITELTKTTHVQDAFLLALGNHRKTLHLCTSVIEDMLRPLPYPTPIKPARPSVQTWSILVRSYMKHNQPAAAEKVIQMMERQGLQPSLVTWNTLVSGYAALQEVNKVISVTERMRERGFDGDERTLEGLGRVINREKLLEALQGHQEEVGLSSEENPPSISASH